MYTARHIGHFGNIAMITPGMIQPNTSAQRRGNVRSLEFSQQHQPGFIETSSDC